jgi:cysteine synthase
MQFTLILVVIEDAENAGLLIPHIGSRIFEGTVGSTGISFATIGRAKYVPRSFLQLGVSLRLYRGYDTST